MLFTLYSTDYADGKTTSQVKERSSETMSISWKQEIEQQDPNDATPDTDCRPLYVATYFHENLQLCVLKLYG